MTDMSALTIGNSNINFKGALDPGPLPECPQEIRELPHHYFGAFHIPGIFNVYNLPSEVIGCLKDLYEAERLSDTEGVNGNWLKIIESPLNLTSSLLSNVELIVKIIARFGKDLSHLPAVLRIAKITPIFGLVVCAFESCIEMRGLAQSVSFFKMLGLPSSFHALKNSPEEMDRVLLESLERLDKAYCNDTRVMASIQNLLDRNFPDLDPAQKEKKVRQYRYMMCGAADRNLIRRIHSRCAQKVHDLVPRLLREYGNLKANEKADWRGRACELLTDVKAQAFKKTLMHVLGLLAVAITIAGLIATLCGCPVLVPFVLLLVGGILSTGRVCISKGMMHTTGYQFDIGNLIPNWIKTLYQKIFHRSIPNTLKSST